MLDRLTRIQLMIFAVVTVLTVGAITIFYLHLPAAVGIGAYKVDANFEAGGGIYENANVTFRGVTVGRVEGVGLTNDGIVAHMRLNSGTPVPDNVTATVKSVSAVGEQYIDLVPPENPSSAKLRNGANIGQDRTAIGQDIAGLLDESERLVASVGDTRLQDLLSETFKAFNGSGPELARLIESSRLLVDEANNNYGQTTAADRSGRSVPGRADPRRRRHQVAGRRAGPAHRRSRECGPAAEDDPADGAGGRRGRQRNLQRNTAVVPRARRQPRELRPHRRDLQQVAGAGAGDLPCADRRAGHGGRRRARPTKAASSTSRSICRIRRPAAPASSRPPQIRSPADTTLRDIPPELYCKTAQNDPSVVRGARNYPCQEFPGKRAPTIQLCRDPKGYVPIGSNPWRGPPIPYGSEPINDPRMILPQNKFPFIPPQVDPDPGAPVVQLPPGVAPGPGPAPHGPFPLPVPPNEPGPLPSPWPFYAPPDQVVPPYGRTPPPPGAGDPLPLPGQPPADAPPPADVPPLPAEAPPMASASYDQNGKFVDPAGGTGVFAGGTDTLAPAENWVDLMLAPRQA